MVNLVGKSRPSVVNILEGSRSFELQIWWEIPTLLAEVYPIRGSFSSEAEKPEEKEDGGARAPREWGSLTQEVMMHGRRGRSAC